MGLPLDHVPHVMLMIGRCRDFHPSVPVRMPGSVGVVPLRRAAEMKGLSAKSNEVVPATAHIMDGYNTGSSGYKMPSSRIHRNTTKQKTQRGMQYRPRSGSYYQEMYTLAEGLETPVQLIYLTTLLGFLVVGAYLVVRQVLIRRELEEAAKVLGERVRNQEASGEDYFELGVILLRKKLFTQAMNNLQKAMKQWDGEPEELAQVHNALGYAYWNVDRVEDAVEEYRQAVTLQPGYLTAWNNLGDAYEKLKKYQEAYDSYSEVLALAPDNSVARERAEYCKTRLDRTRGVN